MALAVITEEQEATLETPCQGCAQRDRRLEALELELRQHRGQAKRRSLAILLFGSLLLAALPPLGVGGVLAVASVTDGLLEVVATYGAVIAVAGLFTSWVVFAICAMLSWRPLGQCAVIFPPAFLAAGASLFLLPLFVDGDFGFGLPTLAVFPVLLLVALAPCFVMRVWGRWTLAPRDRQVQPRAASIATLLATTGVCAAAAACLRGFEPGEGVTSPLGELGVLFVMLSYLGIPAFCIGLALTVCLRVTLTERTKRKWLALCVLILVTPLASSAVGAAMCSVVQVNGQPLSWDGVWGMMLTAGSAGIGTLVVALPSFLTLRWAGQRLLTAWQPTRSFASNCPLAGLESANVAQ